MSKGFEPQQTAELVVVQETGYTVVDLLLALGAVLGPIATILGYIYRKPIGDKVRKVSNTSAELLKRKK